MMLLEIVKILQQKMCDYATSSQYFKHRQLKIKNHLDFKVKQEFFEGLKHKITDKLNFWNTLYIPMYYIQNLQQSRMSNQPFIIKTKFIEPTVPINSQVYDETQETCIQIVQAINGYLTINMLVESLKIFWAFWHYQTQCPAFSYLSLGFMAINIIWAICSYYGFKTIRSKNSRNIRIFSYTVIFNLIIRIAMYIVSGVIMKGKVPSYASITPDELNNLICSALYPKSLYIATGIIQALLCLLVIIMLRTVVLYVEQWENSQTIKHIPLRQKSQKEDEGY